MRGKRILALFLVLLLTLGLTASGGGETGSKTTKYAGDYRVSSLRIGGERYEYADLAAEGMADKVYLKINEDGSGVLNLGYGEIEIKVDDWNGISTPDGEETLKFWEEGVTTPRNRGRGVRRAGLLHHRSRPRGGRVPTRLHRYLRWLDRPGQVHGLHRRF